nr:Uncharacterised protein [Klebsiella pneumoniae]
MLAQTEGYAHYDEMVSAFASFESVVRGAQQQVQADARHFAEARKTEKVIYMMGSGPHSAPRIRNPSVFCWRCSGLTPPASTAASISTAPLRLPKRERRLFY